MQVPLFDMRVQYRGLQKSIEDAVHRVLASGQVILGPEVEAFEKEVAQYLGVGYAVGCASGSDALLLALKALDIGPGDEVIVPTFTFFATAASVVRAGATPVFADVEPDTANIHPREIAERVTARTKAVIVVHLFGQCADMEPIWRLAERHGFYILEDAAQAFGAEYQGKKAGTLGHLACFSFYPTKNLGACGDAGMVTTNDPDWAARVARLRVHGMEPKYYHPDLGWNSRLDALQAAILRVKLAWVERFLDARRAAARRYQELLEHEKLGYDLYPLAVRSYGKHTFNQYVVRVAHGQRDALMRHLQLHGIGAEIYYPLPLHLQPCFRQLGYRGGDFPTSEQLCQEVLALPMYPELTYPQQKHVIHTCAAYFRQEVRLAA
ncbi:MAG: DegT/DnrJ/EryC1/StrS family aminotransferase [Gemmatales bacterium]|nr:DegT/DnrJ/EryC1/StrS family aminotransferase [Gemmatales bacterium]MCS7159712.1 DegT/DnrJ/EryC1/StrS family aminotransferase [Gemmatales bacterium]MDW8174910.1 DegT/DnrJ/EryC1/StrS family aminotransferase [Gemmatales bacterium]